MCVCSTDVILLAFPFKGLEVLPCGALERDCLFCAGQGGGAGGRGGDIWGEEQLLLLGIFCPSKRT